VTLPAGYRERRATPADAAAARLLVNAEGLTFAGTTIVGEDWPQRDWSGPHAAPQDFVVVEGPFGEICAYAGVDALSPFTQVFAIAAVAPAHHGRGLGAALLRGNERRAVRLASLAPPDARVVLDVATLAGEPRAGALLAAHGYREVRRFLRMWVAFDAPPEPPAPVPGIELRAFRPGRDERPLYEAHAAAFADHWGDEEETYEEWAHHVYAAADFAPDLWLLAWDGAGIAGYAGCGIASAEHPDRGRLRVLGVLPAYRRRGLGEALARAAFAALHRRGRRGCDLGVDAASPTGADRLYARLGMRAEPRIAIFERELRPAGA
jgi:mycothiol synthase